MRILWVEDEASVIRDKMMLFGTYAQQHEVIDIQDFSAAYQRIKGELQQYDLLVLDIDLRESHKSSQIITELTSRFEDLTEPRTFLKEAGFHLYLMALEQGFPRERIAFLTGNMNPDTRARRIQQFKVAHEGSDDAQWNHAVEDLGQLMSLTQRDEFNRTLETQNQDVVFKWLETWLGHKLYDDTYDQFTKRFQLARLSKPEAFDKKEPTCPTKLQGWLATHGERPSSNRDTYDYLTLRRGMLDVIKEIENDSTVNLSPEFQTDLDKDTFLRGLAWLLHDFALPPAPQETTYLGLCDYLTKPFEKYRWPEVRNENQVHFKMPLYFLRNWLAHGLIIGSQATRLSAQEVGMTFLLVMQCLFGVEKYGFQEELKRLFDQTPITTEEVTTLLQKTGFPSGLEVIYNKGFKGGKHPNPDWRLENYVLLFYASYLVCIRNSGNTLQPPPFNDMVVHELQKYLA
ncbi:MAG: hypothetical protein BWK78_05915 [Thiotrichaceae bacterium IS1]|nr:MAG: hypothetical protein BWK78_05915 [Thiotrichaceae bacterium IS1]